MPFALLTEGNFTATILSAPASFGPLELTQLWAALKKAPTKTCVLDGDFYARFLPGDVKDFDPQSAVGIPGWSGFHLHTKWDQTGPLIRGFASGGQGLAVVSGLPIREPQADLVSSATNIKLPIGLTVVMTKWFSNASRCTWRTFDVMLGAAVLDATALKLVKST